MSNKKLSGIVLSEFNDSPTFPATERANANTIGGKNHRKSGLAKKPRSLQYLQSPELLAGVTPLESDCSSDIENIDIPEFVIDYRDNSDTDTSSALDISAIIDYREDIILINGRGPPEKFKVKTKHARLSQFISDVMAGDSDCTEIPIKRVDAKTLSIIVDFLDWHASVDQVEDWGTRLAQLDQKKLEDVLHAAAFMGITALLKASKEGCNQLLEESMSEMNQDTVKKMLQFSRDMYTKFTDEINPPVHVWELWQRGENLFKHLEARKERIVLSAREQLEILDPAEMRMILKRADMFPFKQSDHPELEEIRSFLEDCPKDQFLRAQLQAARKLRDEDFKNIAKHTQRMASLTFNWKSLIFDQYGDSFQWENYSGLLTPDQWASYAWGFSRYGLVEIFYFHSSTPIHHSLTDITDPALQKEATDIFKSILCWCGEMAGDGRSDDETARAIIQRALESLDLRREIYCQLVKQLTRNGDINSTMEVWDLMQLMIINVLPSKDLENYLELWLRNNQPSKEICLLKNCFPPDSAMLLHQTMHKKVPSEPEITLRIPSDPQRSLLQRKILRKLS